MNTSAAQADPFLSALADEIESGDIDPRWAWRQTARESQLLPTGSWRVTYYQGGRGSGKTRSGSSGLVDLILSDPEPDGEWGIIAPTYRDAWTVCVEGEAGILKSLGTSAGEVKQGISKMVTYAHRSYGEIGLRNGHTIYVDSADDGALRVQGKNLKGAWCDEIGLWTRWAIAWDESIKYAVRRGVSKIITTGTPKVSRPAAKLIRRFIRGEEPGCVVRRLRTIDNLDNLSDGFIQAVVGMAKGTRLERQELEGELLDDVENALWTRDMLEALQAGEPTLDDGRPVNFLRVIVGVDPSDGKEDSDEQAYTVAGLGNDGRLYILESWGGQAAPVEFAKRVVKVADEWRAEIVVEKNHGGTWLTPTFKQAMKDLKITRPLKLVTASLGKRTRAEPVSALYERGVVRHAFGPHVELEDQMCSFTGAAGERSPDRLDSLVWSCQPFLNYSFGADNSPASVRAWAAAQELARSGAGPEQTMAQRRLAQAHGGLLVAEQSWDLDSFAPKRDDERSHPNVREYR